MIKNFEKNLLTKLLDKYEKSKLSKGGTSKNRSIKLTTKDDVLSTYTSFDSYKYTDDNDAIIRTLERQGFIKAEFNNDSFKSLTLNLDNVDEIYNYLGRKKPSEELNSIKKVLSKFSFENFLGLFINDINHYIDEKYDYPKMYFSDSVQLNLILNIFTKMFELTDDIKKRDFSVKYLGDSKLFESVEGRIIKIIKDYDGNNYDSDVDVLAAYNIVKNSSYALVKNNLILKINNLVINLNDLGYEMSLSDEMIKSLILLDSNVTKVITVENLTSFYSLNDKDAVIIYLAGFHNHTKHDLLLKIYNKFPNAEYWHFSDIDAGGFLIFNNLVEKTMIPFKPYRMGIEELQGNLDKAKKLTENDKRRLNKMLMDERFVLFFNVIKFMLESNVKLEQEVLD